MLVCANRPIVVLHKGPYMTRAASPLTPAPGTVRLLAPFPLSANLGSFYWPMRAYFKRSPAPRDSSPKQPKPLLGAGLTCANPSLICGDHFFHSPLRLTTKASLSFPPPSGILNPPRNPITRSAFKVFPFPSTHYQPQTAISSQVSHLAMVS